MIIVTGGAGFIGTNLVHSLLELNKEVLVVEELDKYTKKFENLNKLNISLNDEFLQYLKNKELINFLILVTIIGILCYQIYKKLDDITIPTIVGVILLLIITTVYFYNISLNTHSKYESKYWNHRYPMKK